MQGGGLTRWEELRDQGLSHISIECCLSSLLTHAVLIETGSVLPTAHNSFAWLLPSVPAPSTGFRLGWATGPAPIIAKLALAAQASCVGPTPLSQVRGRAVRGGLGRVGDVR